MAIHSTTLAWRIPWTEKPGRLQSIRWQRDMTERLILPFFKNPVKVCNKFPEAECGLRWENNPSLLPQTEGEFAHIPRLFSALLLAPPSGLTRKVVDRVGDHTLPRVGRVGKAQWSPEGRGGFRRSPTHLGSETLHLWEEQQTLWPSGHKWRSILNTQSKCIITEKGKKKRWLDFIEI